MGNLINKFLLLFNNNHKQIIIMPTIVYVCINLYVWIFCTYYVALCTSIVGALIYLVWIAYREDYIIQKEFEEQEKNKQR